MHTHITRLAAIAACATLLQGCDNLTTRDEKVSINLDSFALQGPLSQDDITFRALVSGGNPLCSGPTTLNQLLLTVDNYNDIKDYLDSIDINTVRYKISNNTTPVAAVGEFRMTDPATEEIGNVASVAIPAETDVTDWTPFPFVEGGAAIAQHYMDNLDASFSYCARGTPGRDDLSMTIELQLGLTVKVDLL